MVKGAIRIETRLTMGDEYGIYRITEGKQGYLMLAFEEADEARAMGKVIAKGLKVSYIDHIYTEPELTGAVSGRMSSATPNKPNTPKQLSTMVDVSRPDGAVRPKPKKVMGALKLCKELLEGGAVEAGVEDIITDKYIAAGHQPTGARKFARWVLRVAKK